MKNVSIKFKTAERLQDLNGDALASQLVEERKLKAIKHNLISLDERDGILGNDIHIRQCQKLIDEALKDNDFQYAKDSEEKEILEKVVPQFPESLFKHNRRIA